MLDSLHEVAEGYITDDMVEEKRKLAAVMLRRMEVEEWDKQRMKHFYYGLYGLGPWYWDMEERLHNPFFVGARGWNGPPESWVNENQVRAERGVGGGIKEGRGLKGGDATKGLGPGGGREGEGAVYKGIGGGPQRVPAVLGMNESHVNENGVGKGVWRRKWRRRGQMRLRKGQGGAGGKGGKGL